MNLDKNPMRISNAIWLAKRYYDVNTYNHAMRVAGYVAENETISLDYKDECIALAIMHDLLEDTSCDGSRLPENFKKALNALTKPKSQPYEDYCKNLKSTKHTNWRICAYWVKLADIKDHLNMKETLTAQLKEKYLNGLRYLL